MPTSCITRSSDRSSSRSCARKATTPPLPRPSTRARSPTVDQAITLAPWYRDSIGPDGSITVNGADESGDIWADAKLVAVRCDDCGRLLDARGRWADVGPR